MSDFRSKLEFLLKLISLYVIKVSKRRSRLHAHCNYICTKGPFKVVQCKFCPLFSLKWTVYSHVHILTVEKNIRP